jgi:flagellar biosynthesis anti-sigma factor FlgM
MSILGSGKIPENLSPIQRPTLAPVQIRKAQASPDLGGVPADQVTLSSRARQVQSLAAKVESVAEIRTEIVADIQKQIKENTYNVPAYKVAEKLLLEN